jgi:hypothetical protein
MGEQSLALMEKECRTLIEDMESSTDDLSILTVKDLRKATMAMRMAVGTIRRGRESIHGLVTTMLIEEEFNGRKDKRDTQASSNCNSDSWIDATFNVPEEEEE